jgi:hypothetical protein
MYIRLQEGTNSSTMFKFILSTVNKLEFQKAFEHTVRHSIRFKGGFFAVVVEKY